MFDGKGNRSVVLGEKWFAKRLTRGDVSELGTVVTKQA